MIQALSRLLRLVPSLAVSAALATAATLVAALQGGPQMLYALFFGVALNFIVAMAMYPLRRRCGGRRISA